MNNKIIISIHSNIDKEDKNILSDISASLIERTQLSGGGIITEAIILALSPFIIQGVRDVLLSLINKQNNVSIRLGNVEIKNINLSQVMDIISKLQEQLNNNTKPSNKDESRPND